MKHILLYILFVGFFSVITESAQAAFFVSKSASAVSSLSQAESSVTRTANHISETKVSRQLVSSPFRRMERSGLFGDFALLFGILGFFYPLFSIGAILFGFIGMSRKNRSTGLAIAGFVLGLTVLALTIFFDFTPLVLF
jgi:hypothetical protein